MTRKFCLVIISIVILIFLSAVPARAESSQSLSSQRVEFQKTDRDVLDGVIINNNTELQNFANDEGLPGNGTRKDPYVLKNYIIDGEEKSHGLYLRNTDLYFTVDNCIFRNSSATGVEAKQVFNLTFKRNIIKNTTNGLVVESSSDNKFIDNEFLNIGRSGISIAGAGQNNSFYRNRLKNCSFSLRDESTGLSSEEIAENNTVNGKPVIHLKGVTEKSITEPAGQIILVNSKNISIGSLELNGGSDGVEIINSKNILIDNLTVKNQKIGGISCRSSNNITIERSTLDGNLHGISVYQSESIEIIDNNLIENENGIRLYGASNNTIHSNKISSSGNRGIILNTLSGGSLSQSSKEKYSTSNNTIKKNVITDSDGYGIYIGGVSYNNSIYLNIIKENRAEDEGPTGSQLIQAYEDQEKDLIPNHWNSDQGLGNYWGNWSASDEDNDGILEKEYIIDNSNSTDSYPLSSTIGPPEDIIVKPRNGHLRLEWDKPRYSILNDIEKVKIYRGEDSDNLSLYKELNATENIFLDHNVTNGETYFYRLQTSDDEYLSVLSRISECAPDGTSPEVIDYSPRQEEVSVNATIMVEFSEEMEKDSVNISIGQPGEIDGELKKNGKRFYLNLKDNLSYGERYQVNVTGKDIAKNDLKAGDFTWTFKTVSNGTLKGRVVDKNGDPIEDVTVSTPEGVKNFTDENGKFSLEVPPKNIELKFSKNGYRDTDKNFKVESAKTKDIGDIELDKMRGESSRLFWPMAMVGAVILLLGVIASVVFIKDWGREEIPSEEEIYEEDYEEVSEEEFKSWWEEEDEDGL